MLSKPLASEMRPQSWKLVVGQEHLLGPTGALRPLISSGVIPSQSVILYGPPGTGKTTIAKLLARSAVFVELSALNVGVSTLRDEIESAKRRSETFDQRTVLFIDEIHRFAKNQQESLLAAVESGAITLIAATTEKPSTSIVRALISRCLVFELQPLSDEAIAELCDRALAGGLLGRRVSISDTALRAVQRYASGDARKALNLLQAAFAALESSGVEIGPEEIASSGVESVFEFDRDGSFHYDTISAFIKSIRGSDVDAALEYLAVMLSGGERPEFIGRRLMILAAEDVGLADPQALEIAVAANSVAKEVGMPEARIPLAEATIYLALAPKSNSAYRAINEAMEKVGESRLKIPPHLTHAGAREYVYPHDFDPPIVRQQYRGETTEFYKPTNNGSEAELGRRWQRILEVLRGLKG